MRIHVLAVTLACAVLAGCGAGSSNTPPPTPPTPPPSPSITVTAPQDGTTIYGQPVTISVTEKNISDKSQLSVLLNGADITSQLSAPDSNGVQSAQVSQPAVNYGKNQLQVRYKSVRANSTFTVDSGAGLGGSNPSTSLDASTLVTTVTTRVLGTNSDGTPLDPNLPTSWGIQVGGQFYQAPTLQDKNANPCPQCTGAGFQIVIFSRADLSKPLYNWAYATDTWDELQMDSAFAHALEIAGAGPNDLPVAHTQPPLQACQAVGCIMIMQSLSKIGGAMPCYNPNAVGQCGWASHGATLDAYNLAYWLTKLGASGNVLYANGANMDVGYSFIGNIGNVSGHGVQDADSNGETIIHDPGNQNGQFERLGCLDTPWNNPNPSICDSMPRASSSDNAEESPDRQQAGRISGLFVRDNYNLYTFAQDSQTMPPLPYTFGTTCTDTCSPSAASGTYTNVVSINGSTTEGNGQYTMAMPSTSKGGFRLLILNRIHPDWGNAKELDKFYDFPSQLQDLEDDIDANLDAKGLFFLASMGNIQHDDEDTKFSPIWDKFVTNYLQLLGGDPITGKILGDRHAAFNPDSKDDYLLVGKITAYAPPVGEKFTAGSQSKYTAQESGYVINRHTLTNAPWPTQVEGILVPDHQGYYTPHMQGLATGTMSPQVATLSSASLLPPATWLYSADDSRPSTTSGQKDAYKWFSYQICCSDIRATYTNLNASPSVWLTQLYELTYPNQSAGSPEPSCGSNANGLIPCGSFSYDDFTTVKEQLAKEFAYVSDARNLQNNILSLYQSQQSNVGLILQQATDDIEANLQLQNPPPTTPTPWSAFTSDVFPTLSNLAGFLPVGSNYAKTALGIGTLIIDSTTERSNGPTGMSQLMKSLAGVNIAAADLAENVANQYADSLGTLGNDFKRVVSNPTSLAAVGGPIESGQLVWDPTATSIYLRAFDLTTRRQFYPQLMHDSNGAYWLTRIRYSDWQYFASNSHYKPDGCKIDRFHEAQDNLKQPGFDDDGEDLRSAAWWPSVIQVSSGPNSDYPHNPGAFWWEIWAIGDTNIDSECPVPSWNNNNTMKTFGMFDPVDESDTTQSNGLGLWKPYVFEGVWTHPTIIHTNSNGCGNNSCP